MGWVGFDIETDRILVSVTAESLSIVPVMALIARVFWQ
jgi:hypothetical protein